jgi:hypothetical protein
MGTPLEEIRMLTGETTPGALMNYLSEVKVQLSQ